MEFPRDVTQFRANSRGGARTVRRSPKSIRKKPVWRIEKNLKNVIWYSSYESIKTGKRNTFLVSFIIPVSLPNKSGFALIRSARYF